LRFTRHPLRAAVAAAIAATSISTAHAASWVWLGGDGDWNNALSWSLPGFPNGFGELVTIDGGNVLASNVSLNVNATVAGLTISTGDSLSILSARQLVLGGPFSNDGTLRLVSTGSFTDLVFTSNVSVSGTGSILLSSQTNNRILGSTGTERFTLGAGQVLRGAGQLGVNQLKITNLGTIVADQPGGLTIAPTNAVDGFLNAGGVIEVKSGGQVNFYNGPVTGGTLRGESTAALIGGNGSGVLKDVAFEGAMTLRNANVMALSGSIANTGALHIESTGSFTDLIITSNTSITGTGAIVLGDHTNNRIYGSTGSERLTVGAGQTIRGGGQLGTGQLKVSNQGLIVADQAATLSIFTTNAADSFDNAGGVLEVKSGSLLHFTTANVVGGTLRGQSTTAHIGGNGSAVLNGVAIDGVLTLRNANSIGIAGALTNTGVLHLASTGSFTDLRVAANATVSGSGAIAMGNHGNNRIYGATGSEVLTVGPGQTIRGSGQLGVNQLKIANQGRILADQAATLEIHTTNAADNFANVGGVLEVKNGSLMHLRNANVTGGTLTGQSAAAQIGGNGSATLRDLAISGAITLRNANALGLAGTITNNGAVHLASTGSFTDFLVREDTTLAGTGSFVFDDHGNNRIYGVGGNETLTIGASHTVRGGGQLGANQLRIVNQGAIVADQATTLLVDTTNGVDTFLNRGTIRVEASRTMVVAAANTLVQDEADAASRVFGTLSTSLVDLRAGLLEGTGTVIGAVSNTGGTVGPGASPGKLTIQGTFSQGAGGKLAIEIDGTAQGTEYDWLAVTGNATLGGDLVLDFDYLPVVGSSFTILTTGTGNVSGTFARVLGPGGWQIDTDYNLKDVTITVTAVPEPETYALFAVGLGVVVAAARRRRSRVG